MDVTVVVATYGGDEWQQLAQRAVRSAERQAPTIHVHGTSLHDARNEGLAQVETEWVIFLDADDELEPGYIHAMSQGIGDVRVPIVRYVRGHPRAPQMPKVAGHKHECTAECLRDGNWIVVGAAVRAQMVRDVGGWRDFPWSEDWDLWLRCWLAGAKFQSRLDAVYRAHVRLDSRNRAPTRAAKDAAHWAIYNANFPAEVAA